MKELYVGFNKTEYFCKDCQQLRLSLRDDNTKCGNCGSKDIITGKCGELNKEALIMLTTKGPSDEM
jgi:DNA-directed RNA polymerase subunit RPC12/RpoP